MTRGDDSYQRLVPEQRRVRALRAEFQNAQVRKPRAFFTAEAVSFQKEESLKRLPLLAAARVTTSAGYGVGQSGLGGIPLLFRLTHASKKLRELDVTGARERLNPDDLGSVVKRFADRSRRFSADDLAGTLFCEKGESPLRVLRCSKTN